MTGKGELRHGRGQVGGACECGADNTVCDSSPVRKRKLRGCGDLRKEEVEEEEEEKEE